jgi:hypothetical protein
MLMFIGLFDASHIYTLQYTATHTQMHTIVHIQVFTIIAS